MMVISFGAGTIVAFDATQNTLDVQLKNYYKTVREFTVLEIVLSCANKNFAVVNGFAISCALIVPKQESPTKKAPEEPNTKYQSA